MAWNRNARMSGSGFGEMPFNQSVQWSEMAIDLFKQAHDAKKMGETLTYFRCLEAIYLTFECLFSLEESQACRRNIKSIEVSFSNANSGRGQVAASLSANSMFIGENRCDDLHILLSRLLVKYKLTYYRKPRKDPLDEIKEDFGEEVEEETNPRLELKQILEEIEGLREPKKAEE